ncbi:hypothetical protein AMTR_s00081p00088180 [Amborella trichopoda]|uniref:C3H1-type domain-containing protein n=2 Tax=Amborella trichopoda TaxID=13333 RepID=W1PA63_AMBTC|nr:hypothetical protein AMTR_s00081p00088180 [Amborella trichopoda]
MKFPCYFFFNTYCVKGDMCPFMHGTNGVAPASKPSKLDIATTDAHPIENKSSHGNDTGIPKAEQLSIGSVPSAPNEVQSQLTSKGMIEDEAPVQALERSPTPQVLSEGESYLLKFSSAPSTTVGLLDGKTHLSPDHSSEDNINNNVEPEEWCESSPGLDVLVDDGSEPLGFNEDSEYVMDYDGDLGHLLRYEYDEQCGFKSHDYADTGNPFGLAIYDSYDHELVREYGHDYLERGAKSFMGRPREPLPSHSKRAIPRNVHRERPGALDLRDHLRKRSRNNGGGHVSRNPRRHHRSSDRSDARNRQLSRRSGGWVQGRLASEVVINRTEPDDELGSGSKGSRYDGISRHSQLRHGKFKYGERERREKERRRTQEKSSMRFSGFPNKFHGQGGGNRGSAQEFNVFQGPKTLAEIKEEKRRAQGGENGSLIAGPNSRNPRRGFSGDFQGPKPLSEILKNKYGNGSVNEQEYDVKNGENNNVENYNGDDADGEMMYRGDVNIGLSEADDEYMDDDDDDDFSKKLGGLYA